MRTLVPNAPLDMVSSQGYVSCGGGANLLIERWFGDCVYTSWETVAFLIGISSVCFWLVAQLPQFISNFLRKSADALSPWFLAQWLAGDTFNFLGCVLTGDQLATQTITAGYFMFSDAIIIAQYIYYQIRNGKDAYYSDSDESLHKGTGYADLQKPKSSKDEALLEKLLEQNGHSRVPEGMEKCAPQSSSIHNHPTAHRKQAQENEKLRNALKPEFLLPGSTSSNLVLPTALESSGEKLKAFTDIQQHDNWMYEQRHRLRRLTEQYGLECGDGMASRLNVLYKKNKRKGGGRRGDLKGDSVSSKRRVRTKALLGFACLLGLASTIKISSTATWSGRSNINSVEMGIVLGRRSLLSLSEAVERSWLAGDTRNEGENLLLDVAAFSWTTMLGRLLGWGSSMLYLGSRLSQLAKNKERETADGLSLGMVTCAILANLTYGTAIVMRGSSWSYIMGKAPWLVGSLGTVFLDLTIFVQAQYYSRNTKKGVPSEYTALLV